MTDTNKYGLSRYIKSPIRREIRKRCGFGCVRCGAPIYQYHHIDPPFEDAIEHSPSKMAILCGTCHDKTTRGLVGMDEILRCVANPFAVNSGEIQDRFEFTEHIISLGGAIFYRPQSVLRIGNKSILSMSEPECKGAPPKVSAELYDSNGNRALLIDDNEYTAYTSTWDVEWVGQTLTIRAEENRVSLRYTIVPDKYIIIEKLDMMCDGIRVRASDAGVVIGDGSSRIRFKGAIHDCESCIEVRKFNV